MDRVASDLPPVPGVTRAPRDAVAASPPPVRAHPFRPPVPAGGPRILPPPPPKVRLAFLIPACLLLGLFCLVELVHQVAPWLYLGLGFLFAKGLLRKGPAAISAQKKRLLALAVPLGFMALLYFVPWNSQKAFRRDLDKIHYGMSEAEVRQIMKGYMEGSGFPPNPFTGEPADTFAIPTLVFRHSDDPYYNSDRAGIEFHGGKVSGVWFQPD